MDFALDLIKLRMHLASGAVLPDAAAVLQVVRQHVAEVGQEAVRLLQAVSEIVEGFSPQLAHIRSNEKTSRIPFFRAGSVPLTDNMSLAQDELCAFARKFAGQLTAEQKQLHDNPPLHWMAPATGGAEPYGRGSTDIYALHALLSGSSGDVQNGTELLIRLKTDCSGLDDLQAATMAAAPFPDLLGVVSALNLLAFLRTTEDLASGRIGSPAMLQAAARFDSFGLGPYFRNVGSLARHSRDVFELASLAASAAAESGKITPVELWVALLARSLHGPLLLEVVDDLGDLDARAALSILLGRAVNDARAVDLPMVMRLRDISLDNLDYQAAAQAQRYICDARPGNVLELEILGTIHGSLGNTIAAEQVLEGALQHDPNNPGVRERLLALKEFRFGPYALTRGFGSPEDRLHARQARRSRRAHSLQAAPQNLASVEFTF